MPRVVVTVGSRELEALVEWAMSEYRTPRDQVRFILSQALLEREAAQKGGIEVSQGCEVMKGSDDES